MFEIILLPKKITMDIQDCIRKFRLKCNYSQEGFASLLGKSRSWVCKMEAGEIDPKLSVLKEIAAKCKINLSELVTGKIEKTSEDSNLQ